MKKLALVLAVAFGLGFASCEKCVECTYDFQGTSVSSGDICGSSGDIDDLQAAYEASVPDSLGVTITCVDK